MCVPFRPIKGQHIKNFDPPTHLWDNPEKLFMFIGFWGEPQQPMKLQQPRNYDFWMFQFNLLGSQGGNSREMTTSPPGHY